MAKNKNYLVRTGGDKFTLGRGEKIEENVAVVRLYEDLEPLPRSWCIIDIPSGLNIGIQFQPSKAKCLEKWASKSATADFKARVTRARQCGTYKLRCEELRAEKQLWRLSGYEIN